MPQKPEGILHVVATPLGNLQDLSARARETLGSVDAVLCEDTRHTLKLMSFLGLSKPLERLDQHASAERVEGFAAQLEAGRSFALVSDAGTPGISDPGAALVAECHRRGIRVVPVPGPSAVVTLLSAAGFAAAGFTFLGFAPRAEKDVLDQLARIRGFPLSRCWVWFESPHRIEALLAVFSREIARSRAAVAKELTKVHEKLFIGSVSDVHASVRAEVGKEGEKGEWALAIEIADEDLAPEESGEAELRKILRAMLNAGVSASRAAREASQSFGVKRNFAYDLALAIEAELRDAKRVKKN